MSDFFREDGRMLAAGDENPAQIHDLDTIELQSGYGGVPDRSKPYDLQIVFAPGEVVGPFLTARMKQRHKLARKRIAGFDPGTFMIIATLTREREITGSRFAAAAFGSYMLDGERMRRIARLAHAILADALCAGDDQAAQLSASAGLRHNPVQAGRDLAAA